jgi:hypothetical protein
MASTRAPTSAGPTPDLPVLRIVQFPPLSRSGSSDSHWNLLRKLTHRSFRHFTVFRPVIVLFDDRRIENRVSGFSNSRCLDPLVPDFPTSNIPMRSFVSLAPGYAFSPCELLLYDRSHIPYWDSGFRVLKCSKSLTHGIPDLPTRGFPI